MKHFSLVLLALVATTAWAELVDKIAAIVNSDIITLSEIEARAAPELARLRDDAKPGKWLEVRNQLLKKVTDTLIGEKLMEAQVRELNIEVADSEIEMGIDDVKKQNSLTQEQFEQLLGREGYTMPTYRSFMRKHFARMKLINLKVRSKVKISDEDLKAEYAKTSYDLAHDVEVHARHILIQVATNASAESIEAARHKALSLAVEARKPGVDFAELAKKKSEGPSAAEGGDLGFFRRGVMVPEFERIAFSLADGSVADPIRTQFGWHVIKVEERRSLPPPPFDEVKEQLREKMLRSQLERYTDQYVQELRATALVEVKI